MTKKVSIGTRPTAARPATPDDWVTARTEPQAAPASPTRPEAAERMKRLTIDIPEDLHRAIKRQCADEGTKIADVARSLLRDWVAKS
ncbi:plasmid partition protein ParG [Haematobacter massiliensis]|uniref:plasmid partition protein ParG n=1 Tax=Haematobacter massiliensis TaxID=195105 RepID=UPI0023EF7235|nr:plasmid partition protein ParG [Haematobacter massiliensis]